MNGQQMLDFPAIVVMGVSGSGKSLIGRMLAERVAGLFVEGDDLHPPANLAKMSAGMALNDDDRWPWLDAVGRELGRLAPQGPVIAACSALKRAYRDRLRATVGLPLFFVFLAGSPEMIRQRLAQRQAHFFPPSLLDSQFALLEPPGAGEPHVRVELTLQPAAIVDAVVAALHSYPDR